jgi:hypothetical protein
MVFVERDLIQFNAYCDPTFPVQSTATNLLGVKRLFSFSDNSGTLVGRCKSPMIRNKDPYYSY